MRMIKKHRMVNATVLNNRLIKNKGMTLIELLISLSLVVMVVAAATKGFGDYTRTKYFIKDVALMNENGRYALQILERGLRNAGDTGCPAEHVRGISGNPADPRVIRFASNIEIGGSPAWFANYHHAVEGVTNTVGMLPAGVTQVVGSSTFVIHAISPERVSHLLNEADFIANTSPAITTQRNHGFEKGKPLLLIGADCRQMAMFNLTAGEGGANVFYDAAEGNCSGALVGHDVGCKTGSGVAGDYIYPRGSELHPVTSRLYYVNDEDELSFVRATDPENAYVLVDGVDHFEVTYGLDTDNDGIANQYSLAEDMPFDSWRNVTSIDVALMLRSNADVLPQARTRTCGTQTSISDRRLRTCFQTRINIRNRGGVIPPPDNSAGGNDDGNEDENTGGGDEG